MVWDRPKLFPQEPPTAYRSIKKALGYVKIIHKVLKELRKKKKLLKEFLKTCE